MFKEARLKLTLWYLAIILSISLAFSTVIYKAVSTELERFGRMQKFRIERGLQEGEWQPPLVKRENFPPIPDIDPELLWETKQRVLLTLAFINFSIAVGAGLLGYLLAGWTLKPIQEMLNQQNRFITDASHELRTPITSLKSNLEVNLRDKKLSLLNARLLMKESLKDVDKLQSLADSLLQLAQYQKPNSHLVFEPVLLINIVNNAVRRVQSIAKKKKITITQKVPHIKIKANQHSLEDLIIIFLDNAIKFSPVGNKISIVGEKLEGTAKLSIRDQGMGISKKDLPHIFERFYRSENLKTNQSRGYGLGLAIAKSIADINKININVASIPNKGSTFSLIFHQLK